MGDFDVILDKLGPSERYQIINILYCCIATLPSGLHTVLNAFIMSTPKHWCRDPDRTNQSYTSPENLTLASQQTEDSSCWVDEAQYLTKLENYTNIGANFENVTKVACTDWGYEESVFGRTGVSKWDLVCSRSTYPAIAQSIYMFGFLLGTLIFGYLSDRLGRCRCIVVSAIAVIVFGLTSVFLPQFWSHVFMRMLVGICTASLATTTFVLQIELIGIKKRLFVGLASGISFALGYMLLAGVAYFTRDFIWTNLAVSLVPTLLFLFLWNLSESPRWLMGRGKISCAKKELVKAARMNRAHVDVDKLMEEYISLNKQEKEGQETNFTFLDLMRTPNIRRTTFILFIIWFSICLVFYGLTMGSTSLAGDPYLNLFLSGLFEIVGILSIWPAAGLLGRRLSLIVSLLAGGLACTVRGIVPNDEVITHIVLSLAGKMFVSGAFSAIYVFSAELYPTVIRTIGVGAGSMSARVGAFVAPFIGELRHVWGPLPTVVFGTLSILAGMMVILLPETLEKSLPETIEGGEIFLRRRNIFARCQKKTKQRTKKATDMKLFNKQTSI